jgi:hypothetical protein
MHHVASAGIVMKHINKMYVSDIYCCTEQFIFHDKAVHSPTSSSSLQPQAQRFPVMIQRNNFTVMKKHVGQIHKHC